MVLAGIYVVTLTNCFYLNFWIPAYAGVTSFFLYFVLNFKTGGCQQSERSICRALFYQRNAVYSGLTCNQNVTGPSFINDTCISAANSPVCTTLWAFFACVTQSLYKDCAKSGDAAGVKLARVPLFVSAAKVNCDTISNPPCAPLPSRF